MNPTTRDYDRTNETLDYDIERDRDDVPARTDRFCYDHGYCLEDCTAGCEVIEEAA